MEIVLDTNFILACIEKKADIFEIDGVLVLGREVVDELEEIKEGGAVQDRQYAEIALKMIVNNKERFHVIDLGESYVDAGIEKYVEGKENMAVATLDAELKKKLKGKVKLVTIVARKKFGLN